MGFSLKEETLSGVCVLCQNWNHNHTLVQEHVHRVYTIILACLTVHTYVNVYVNQVWRVYNRHACMLMQIIMHTSNAYTSALHESFYVIDLCVHMHAFM